MKCFGGMGMKTNQLNQWTQPNCLPAHQLNEGKQIEKWNQKKFDGMNQLLAAFIVDVVGYRPEAHLPQKNFTQSISPIDFTRLLCPINSIAPAKTGSPKFISSLISEIDGLSLGWWVGCLHSITLHPVIWKTLFFNEGSNKPNQRQQRKLNLSSPTQTNFLFFLKNEKRIL